MGVVSYRADSSIVEFLRALEGQTSPYLLPPSEWIVSADGEYLYVDYPERPGSFFLSNIWKGMKPDLARRVVWADQFTQALQSLPEEFARLYIDSAPRVDEQGNLYLDIDFGIQKFFQNLRPTKERERLPWSFLLSSSPNRRVVPIIWTGYHVYSILTNGGLPLSDRFRVYLTSVPPGVVKSPFGEYPPYQKSDEITDELNGILENLLVVNEANQFKSYSEALGLLREALTK